MKWFLIFGFLFLSHSLQAMDLKSCEEIIHQYQGVNQNFEKCESFFYQQKPIVMNNIYVFKGDQWICFKSRQHKNCWYGQNPDFHQIIHFKVKKIGDSYWATIVDQQPDGKLILKSAPDFFKPVINRALRHLTLKKNSHKIQKIDFNQNQLVVLNQDGQLEVFHLASSDLGTSRPFSTQPHISNNKILDFIFYQNQLIVLDTQKLILLKPNKSVFHGFSLAHKLQLIDGELSIIEVLSDGQWISHQLPTDLLK
jgi:hypothetical protein